MLAYDFGIIDNAENELAFRIAVYTAALTSDRMILIIFSSLFSLLLLLRDASFTRRFSALTRFSAASIKTAVASRAFSILRAITKLKKFIFSVSSYLSLCFSVIFSLF